MKILVTGANGFIGRNLTRLLSSEGHDIVEHIYSSGRIDAIVHLAAVAGISPKLQQAQQHYATNVMQTIGLLEFCVTQKIPRFVFISSSSVYGDNGYLPSLETDPTDNPICHYAATKKSGEIACYTYHYQYGIEVTCLRLFTVYGPGQKTEMAIPLFTKSIWRDKEITIFGEGYRDYVYVDDVSQSIKQSLYRSEDYQIYNIGSGKRQSLQELITHLEGIIGKKAKVKYQSNPIGYAESTWANIEKAKRELDYEPRVPFKEGLKRYVDWFISQKF